MLSVDICKVLNFLFEKLRFSSYGVVLSELGNTIDAQKQLIKSVESFPLNWSAWEQLALLCENMDMINEITGKIRISNHWIISFFQVEALNQLHATFKAFEVLEAIQSSGEFPFVSSYGYNSSKNFRVLFSIYNLL
jgi:hypothetical protein